MVYMFVYDSLYLNGNSFSLLLSVLESGRRRKVAAEGPKPVLILSLFFSSFF